MTTINQTSFFYGEAVAPEVNNVDELVSQLEAQVATVVTAQAAAASSAASALAAQNNAAISESNVSGLAQQATSTLASASTALNTAQSAVTAASASQAAAATSATSASASATTATTQASNAAASATSAATQATNSASSATAALGSQNAAATSASAASTSAGSAATNATNAATAVTNATTQANNAASSASAAASSYSNAQTQANAAASSASTASTQATNATNSATTAASSATSAATQATNAANSATAAANSAALIALPIAVTSGGTGATSVAGAVSALGLSTMTGKNRIINGDCRIQQKASTGAVAGTFQYGGVDRFANVCGSGQTPGVTQQGQVDADENGTNKNWVRHQVTTAVTDFSGTKYWGGITQFIEGINVFDLKGNTKGVTVSFRFKAKLPGTYGVTLFDNTVTNSVTKTITVAAADTPQYFAVSFPTIPVTVSANSSYTTSLAVRIGALNTATIMCPTASLGTWQSPAFYAAQGQVNWGASTSNYIQVTDLQFEEGQVATPFERRPYSLELALCQRYYEKSYADGVAPGTASAPGAWDTAAYNTSWFMSPTVPFRATKRAVPTITFYSHVSGASGKFYDNNAGADVTAAVGGFTGVNNLQAYGNNLLVTGHEYMFHWAASAEL